MLLALVKMASCNPLTVHTELRVLSAFILRLPQDLKLLYLGEEKWWDEKKNVEERKCQKQSCPNSQSQGL